MYSCTIITVQQSLAVQLTVQLAVQLTVHKCATLAVQLYMQLCITVPGAHDGRGWMEKPTNLHISFPKLDIYLQILLTFWHIFHGFKQFLGGYWKHQLKA